jgi:hypothetical protein
MIIPTAIREKALDFTESELEDYFSWTIKFLETMKADTRIEISRLTRESNRELFIEIVKFYIRTNAFSGGIEFNADFSIIKKYDLFL